MDGLHRLFLAILVVVFHALGAAPARGGETSPTGTAASDGADFTADAVALFRIAACAPGERPALIDARIVDAHCRSLRRAMEAYTGGWLATARPFLAGKVPATVPKAVVYPFGGGDLLTALATFPEAQEFTLLSLETAGNVRAIRTLPAGKLESLLRLNRENIGNLFRVAHSKTTNLGLVMRGDLPGQLIFSLAALAVHGYEPFSLRYFRLEPDGAIHYLTEAEIAAAEVAAGGRKAERARIYANAELRFRGVGGGPDKTYRHISANLDDVHLRKDPSPIRHLEAKGHVAAMTKAASYLLWWGEFSTIRNYLLAHVDWMISDSTGIPPKLATPSGFEYETYGRFAGPFLPAGREGAHDFRALWRNQPKRPLPFRYGYPDSAGQNHLVIMRRAAPPAR